MKYLFLLPFFAFATHSDAQLEGFPFIDSTSEWYFKSSFVYFDFEHCNQNFAIGETLHTYYIQGDTTMGGKNYFKVYADNINTNYCLNDTTIQWTNYSSQFDRYLREENYKLYTYNTGSETDILFRNYDDIDIGTFLNNDCVVGSIDTLFLLNQPFLRYNCVCNTEFLIQAIGTKRTPFTNTLECGIGIEGDYKNLCYRKNGFVIKVDSTANCISTGDTSLYVSIKDVTRIFNDKFYPNPTKGIVQIDLFKNFTGNYLICSIDGRQVRSGRFFGSDKLFVDFSELNAGVYFLFLQLENGKMARHKIIKI